MENENINTNEGQTQPEANPEKQISKYELKKQKKEEKRKMSESSKKKSKLTTYFFMAGIVVALFAGVIWLVKQEPTDASPLVHSGAIHWHPELEITIKGEVQEIPANMGIGIGVIHPENIHTHTADGVLHIEHPGPVRENDIKVGRFFEAWNKTFTSECILEYCNGPDGNVKMFVNGEENTDFDNYLMQDKDIIEIIYE